MKRLLSFSFSKIYIIVMILINLLVVGGYFSYAMFTVSKERSNAISIVTGNLTYKLLVDDNEGNTLTVEANTVKDFTITLNNSNNRKARFNFYYIGDLPTNTKVGYIVEDGTNPMPDEKGINLEKIDTTESSNTYIIRIINNSGNSVTINLGVSVGLDYNDLSLPDSGHLFEEITHKGEVGTVVLNNISKDNIHNDGIDTFTTGQYPNNYVWYSGKLWRAVSINNEEKTVKLVTQWNISAIPYNPENQTNFEGSYMEMWLNDKTVDGFLGNLRNPDKFIVTDSVWDATMDTTSLGSIKRPNGTTIVTTSVGLLNIYEYQSSYQGTTSGNGYLNNGLYFRTLTPYNSTTVRSVYYSGNLVNGSASYSIGIRPSINLKPEIKIVSGNGTEENPYRLIGDNDTNLEGVKLNTRYSGEYIRFGTGENNLYRIVSHETKGLTKITSAEPLKENKAFKTSSFGDTAYYSSTNTIGIFLNREYLTNGSYLTSEQVNMIEDNTIWYLGTVNNGADYRLAKYTDTSMNSLIPNTTVAKVGLLRMGELMTGQYERYVEKNSVSSIGLTTPYWTLTPFSMSVLNYVSSYGTVTTLSLSSNPSIKPSLNLKSKVVITGGDGTKNNPFTLELGSTS